MWQACWARHASVARHRRAAQEAAGGIPSTWRHAFFHQGRSFTKYRRHFIIHHVGKMSIQMTMHQSLNWRYMTYCQSNGMGKEQKSMKSELYYTHASYLRTRSGSFSYVFSKFPFTIRSAILPTCNPSRSTNKCRKEVLKVMAVIPLDSSIRCLHGRCSSGLAYCAFRLIAYEAMACNQPSLQQQDI